MLWRSGTKSLESERGLVKRRSGKCYADGHQIYDRDDIRRGEKPQQTVG